MILLQYDPQIYGTWADWAAVFVGLATMILVVPTLIYTRKEIVANRKQNVFQAILQYLDVLKEKLKETKLEQIGTSGFDMQEKLNGLKFFESHKNISELFFAEQLKEDYKLYWIGKSKNKKFDDLVAGTYTQLLEFYCEIKISFQAIIDVLRKEEFKNLDKWEKEIIIAKIEKELLYDMLQMITELGYVSGREEDLKKVTDGKIELVSERYYPHDIYMRFLVFMKKQTGEPDMATSKMILRSLINHVHFEEIYNQLKEVKKQNKLI